MKYGSPIINPVLQAVILKSAEPIYPDLSLSPDQWERIDNALYKELQDIYNSNKNEEHKKILKDGFDRMLLSHWRHTCWISMLVIGELALAVYLMIKL